MIKTNPKTITFLYFLASQFIVLFLIFSFSPKSVLAVNRMTSESYKLQWTNLNMTSGSKESTNFKILDTLGQTAPGEYASSGYYVKAGFPYIKTIIPFAFTISDLSIDFGTLGFSVFTARTNTLTVSAGGAGGYSVTASADHPLQLLNSATTIPDTSCDTSCDQVTADTWTNTAKYGFGYNMSGHDVPSDFNGSKYKQFSDESLNEAPQIVMSSAVVGDNRIATVTYQVNIPVTQSAGNYQNSITYVATPGY